MNQRLGLYTLDEVNAATFGNLVDGFACEPITIQTLQGLEKTSIAALLIDVDGLRANCDDFVELDDLPCEMTALFTYHHDWSLAESWRQLGASIHSHLEEALSEVANRLGLARRRAA